MEEKTKSIRLNPENSKEISALSVESGHNLGAEFVNAVFSSVSVAKKRKIAEKLLGEKKYSGVLNDPDVKAAIEQALQKKRLGAVGA